MLETLILLLTGHLLGDFLLQTSWMVKHKRKPLVLLVHVTVVLIITAVLLGSLHWQVLAIIFTTHLAMDALKTWVLPDTLVSFVSDQVVHVSVVIALAVAYPAVAADSFWLTLLPAEIQHFWYAALALISGIVLVVPAGGYLIATMMRPLVRQLGDTTMPGLSSGGQTIGWLERALVLLFVLIGQPMGVGFVLAAKSILRFGDIKEAGQRKLAEYIIIGTFLSFGWALLVSHVVLHTLDYWLAGAN